MSSSAAGTVPGQAEATLSRRLGPVDAAAIVISNVIGGGIFFVPILVARLTPSAGAMLGVWLFGGLLAFAGAMAYAELATLRPRAGGEYVYLRDAYGSLAAFLSGWTSFVAGFSGAIAAGAVALADYIGRFVPAAASRETLLVLPLPYVPLTVTPQAIVAIGAIVALSMVHLHGTGRIVHNLLAGLKVSALAVFIAIGLSLGDGQAGNLASTHDVPNPSINWLLALVPVMFSYSGWNAAAYVAEEVRDPGRNLPLALFGGTLVVVLFYLALNVLFLYAMPVSDIAALDGRLTDIVAERLFGFVAGNVLAVFTIISIAASVSAMVWAGPRVYYAMARDGVFWPSAAKVHPKFRTPAIAIGAQAAWSSVLVLSGTLSALVAYTGFAVVLFAGVAVLAVFVLRRRHPHAERPFKAFGYPWTPALFVLASALMVGNEIWNSPRTSLAGLAVIVAGVPLYWVLTRQRRVRRLTSS
ncbi:MAG: amino acid permease [Acidobacteria bacterium]|nr:amino acid permease [Acidobacteriota bacterium]